MPTLEIEIPKQTLDHLNMAPDEFAFTMRVMTALKMYELGQISSQEGADLAGVSRVEFLQLLRRYQISPFEWLDETGAPTRPVGELSDAEVLRLSNLQMPIWQSRRLQELLEKQLRGWLIGVVNGQLSTDFGNGLIGFLAAHIRAYPINPFPKSVDSCLLPPPEH